MKDKLFGWKGDLELRNGSCAISINCVHSIFGHLVLLENFITIFGHYCKVKIMTVLYICHNKLLSIKLYKKYFLCHKKIYFNILIVLMQNAEYKVLIL